MVLKCESLYIDMLCVHAFHILQQCEVVSLYESRIMLLLDWCLLLLIIVKSIKIYIAKFSLIIFSIVPFCSQYMNIYIYIYIYISSSTIKGILCWKCKLPLTMNPIPQQCHFHLGCQIPIPPLHCQVHRPVRHHRSHR